MPELTLFDGKIIPVTHLLPDDVLVFSIAEKTSPAELSHLRQVLHDGYPGPRKCLLMQAGIRLAVERDGELMSLGES